MYRIMLLLMSLCKIYVNQGPLWIALLAGGARVCNRFSGYSGYSDIRNNLSVGIAI